ncbi:MAG: enolase C-terminal domain-like protein [Pyrinomonadaceae bacterium]
MWRHLGGTQSEIACGVSIGIQDTFVQLVEKIESELAAGYQRIKVKIKPGWDLAVIAGLRKRFPDIQLMADANSAFTLGDVDLFRQMDAHHLTMIEQPLAYEDMSDHAKLQREIQTPICLDESIRSPEDARKAIELKACRIVNLKLRTRGRPQRSEINRAGLPRRRCAVWCGGMLGVRDWSRA